MRRETDPKFLAAKLLGFLYIAIMLIPNIDGMDRYRVGTFLLKGEGINNIVYYIIELLLIEEYIKFCLSCSSILEKN